ncbi:DUF4180 domain-containing protein [Paenibacillus methanolicus]|uniref:Uncharacterized protein DUF4180 n=1 Tax=Paenibacillus methanolicus TaxID=582686 RepID=A0A5S5CJZ0_9BACL|nr:DUF4180 domain-containing protein [Paenibacillus methanolicus]TYP79055.1 uncharacterized protein DUF4180 [Paenibacillus methanolicus]
MEIIVKQAGNAEVAVIEADAPLITDVQSVLDLMATVRYETGCDRLVVRKEQIAEPFFDLKTRIAGEILQKFINYQFKFAVVGDFSGYESTSLRDFFRESNHGRDAFFVPNEEEALAKLSKA